jgi:DNA-binding SARP family transcriptional activator
MLSIKLLGHTEIWHNGKDISSDLSKKTIALLFLLIVNEGKYLTKDKIALYLWPESSEESSKYNVRYNLWMLSKTIPKDLKGNELIISDKNSCTLNNDYALDCDLMSIMKCDCENAKIKELSEIVEKAFSGDVLEGWFINKCYDFNELILLYRMQLERKQLMILQALSKKYYKNGQLDKSLDVLKIAEQFGPNDESIAACTLKTYSALGDRVSGINYYKNFESRLWKELNIMPNDELQNLYDNLFSTNISCAETQIKKSESKNISLYGFGIASIEWSLVSCIIDSLCDALPETVISKVDPEIISELGFINKKVIIKYNEISNNKVKTANDVPYIRIMQAFSNILEAAGEKYRIDIEIEAFDDADNISKEVINYISKVHKELRIVK